MSFARLEDFLLAIASMMFLSTTINHLGEINHINECIHVEV
jgi:hypothetical protein